MKLLVATSQTQGQRTNDFHWAQDGEPVMFPMECTGAQPDDNCGCARSMAGLLSHKASTTMEVVEMPGVTHEVLLDMVRASLKDSGWYESAADEKIVVAFATEMIEAAEVFPLGTVVERRGDSVVSRVLG